MAAGGVREEEARSAGGPEWSMQRHLTMKACARRYWFEYVAVGDPNLGDEAKAEVQALKRMNSLRFLTGLTVHTALRRLLPKLAAGEEPDLDAAVREAGEWVDKWRAKGKADVTEMRNGAEVPARVFEEVKAEAGAELRAFRRDHWAKAAALEGLEVEKPGRFEVGSTVVKVRLDAVGREKGGPLVIIDWKTGKDDPAYESDLQMGAYARFAVEAGLARGASDVETRLVFLKAGEEERARVSQAQLERVGEAIRADMKRMEPAPRKEEAPPSPEPKKCLACNFATACEAADLSGAKRGPWG